MKSVNVDYPTFKIEYSVVLIYNFLRMHVLLGYLSLHSIQFRFIFVQFSTCVYYPLQSKPKKEKYIKIWK